MVILAGFATVASTAGVDDSILAWAKTAAGDATSAVATSYDMIFSLAIILTP